MFETQDETPQEKRDRSPCGILEVSERKLEGELVLCVKLNHNI